MTKNLYLVFSWEKYEGIFEPFAVFSDLGKAKAEGIRYLKHENIYLKKSTWRDSCFNSIGVNSMILEGRHGLGVLVVCKVLDEPMIFEDYREE